MKWSDKIGLKCWRGQLGDPGLERLKGSLGVEENNWSSGSSMDGFGRRVVNNKGAVNKPQSQQVTSQQVWNLSGVDSDLAISGNLNWKPGVGRRQWEKMASSNCRIILRRWVGTFPPGPHTTAERGTNGLHGFAIEDPRFPVPSGQKKPNSKRKQVPVKKKRKKYINI